MEAILSKKIQISRKMGRAFEFRKSRKIKRWSSMAKIFTKIVKEITICAKEGGTDPKTNSKLRHYWRKFM